MKDLKHLYYFEKLLEDANNELVRQAQSEGLKCIATTCENVPEPLFKSSGNIFRQTACTAYRLYGDGYLLHDKFFCVSTVEHF